MATEKRLIALDELLKFPIRIDHYDKVNGNVHFVYGVETVLEYAEKLPAVDAVEVVRCKDCKHYKPQGISVHWEHKKPYCMRGTAVKVSEDDFCSYGERRTDV